MPLIALWQSNATVVDQFTVEQVVATAGSGELKDASHCSEELREFFSQIAARKLAGYVERCLSSAFPKSGLVLQDLINELGRRLDFTVENGRYQGTTNAVGFDGIWTSPEGRSIVAEVKTTDAYRISLDRIAEYRDQLIQSGRIKKNSSVLIVVGREDTGELEAQVRGSRHAWDVRLLSTEALLKLVQLKENAEDLSTSRKIRDLLFPMEYTRLDQIIDTMFTTATDVQPVAPPIENNLDQEIPAIQNPAQDMRIPEAIIVREKGTWEFTDSRILQNTRDSVLQTVSKSVGAALIAKSRALYWDSTHRNRVACSISKRYEKTASCRYFILNGLNF